MQLELKELSFHRNGVSGLGFYAILFVDYDRAGKDNKAAYMLASVFDQEGACSVIQLNQDGPMTVKFGQNSWRGDKYEPVLREWIESSIPT